MQAEEVGSVRQELRVETVAVEAAREPGRLEAAL